MTFKDRLRAARKARNRRQQDIADAVGVSVQAVSQWERGEHNPEFDRVRRIAEYLDVPIDQLAGDDTELSPSHADPRPNRAPLVSRVAAGHWSEIVSSGQYPPVERYFELTMAAPVGNVLALEIESGSMLPLFEEGDIIIVDDGLTPNPGDFVVAKLDREERATFKKYRPRGYDADGHPVIELAPLNPDYPTLTISAANPGRILATMIEHRRFRRSRR